MKWSRSVVTDSLWPHGLKPTRLLPPWDFPGNSTGVGCHFLLQGIRDRTQVSRIPGRRFNLWATREAKTWLYHFGVHSSTQCAPPNPNISLKSREHWKINNNNHHLWSTRPVWMGALGMARRQGVRFVNCAPWGGSGGWPWQLVTVLTWCYIVGLDDF